MVDLKKYDKIIPTGIAIGGNVDEFKVVLPNYYNLLYAGVEPGDINRSDAWLEGALRAGRLSDHEVNKLIESWQVPVLTQTLEEYITLLDTLNPSVNVEKLVNRDNIKGKLGETINTLLNDYKVLISGLNNSLYHTSKSIYYAKLLENYQGEPEELEVDGEEVAKEKTSGEKENKKKAKEAKTQSEQSSAVPSDDGEKKSKQSETEISGEEIDAYIDRDGDIPDVEDYESQEPEQPQAEGYINELFDGVEDDQEPVDEIIPIEDEYIDGEIIEPDLDLPRTTVRKQRVPRRDFIPKSGPFQLIEPDVDNVASGTLNELQNIPEWEEMSYLQAFKKMGGYVLEPIKKVVSKVLVPENVMDILAHPNEFDPTYITFNELVDGQSALLDDDLETEQDYFEKYENEEYYQTLLVDSKENKKEPKDELRELLDGILLGNTEESVSGLEDYGLPHQFIGEEDKQVEEIPIKDFNEVVAKQQAKNKK